MGTLLFPYAALKSVLVKEGQICLTWNGDKPEILGPGRHVLFKPTNTVHSIKSLSDNLIQHGPISIIRVSVGQLAYGLDTETGKPVVLTPGRHIINSPTFTFKSFLDLSKAINDLGFIKLIRVDTGNVGICNLRNGDLKILKPGFHLISPPDRFVDLYSMQQQILKLPEKDFESSDYVTLTINSDVFYTIEDPKKAFTMVGNIKGTLKEVSVATLSNIIRSSAFADIGQTSKQSYRKETDSKKTEDLAPSAPLFFKHVHDDFLKELHKYCVTEWGISIDNIRIESLHIKDKKFAQDISGQAITYAKVQTELSNAQFQSQIQAAASEREANSLRIKTEAEALAVERSAEAKANALITEAKAKAEASRIEAEGRSKAIDLISKAEASAARLNADSRAYYAEKMQKVGRVGEQVAILDSQATAFSNIQKIVYLSPNNLPTLFNNLSNTKNILLDTDEKDGSQVDASLNNASI